MYAKPWQQDMGMNESSTLFENYSDNMQFMPNQFQGEAQAQPPIKSVICIVKMEYVSQS